MSDRFGLWDLCAIVVLGLVATAWIAHAGVFGTPQEDAAILLRYAQHLADGHGIVWNLGERPVEGATDFVYLLGVAGLARGGLTVERAAWSIGIAAHLLTVLLVYDAVRAGDARRRGGALLAAAYVAFGPALFHVSHAFGATLHALFALLAWIAARRVDAAPQRLGAALWFAACALLLALSRPDGLVLAVLLAASVVVTVGPRRALRPMLVFLALFAFAGGAYFVWRWRYFGYFLPAPMYRKAAARILWHSVAYSAGHVGVMLLPFALPTAWALAQRDLRRRVLAALVPLAGFTLLWGFGSDAQNVAWRFQYPIVPLGVVALAPFAAELWRRAGLDAWMAAQRRGTRALLFVVAMAQPLAFWQLAAGTKIGSEPLALVLGGGDGLHDAADLLRPLADRGYVLATTEAGVLPLYSGWYTIDTWGLNDPELAHRGVISWADLDRKPPHVILIEAHDLPYLPEVDRDWFNMNATLINYARSRPYDLAAVFGVSQHLVHIYYVRRDFADSDRIRNQLSDITYYYFGLAFDFAGAIRAGQRVLPHLAYLR